MTDLEALKWVMDCMDEPLGLTGQKVRDQVLAMIERVEKTEPMKQVYRVMQENGCFVVMEVTRDSLAEDLEVSPGELPSNAEIDEIVGHVAEGNGTYTEIILEGIREVLRGKMDLTP